MVLISEGMGEKKEWGKEWERKRRRGKRKVSLHIERAC